MNEYATFDSDLGACRKCQSILNAVPVDPCISDQRVEPRPIVSGIRRKPILLIGQAPGKTEYDQRRPFQGRAGQTIRAVFREVGVLDFDTLVYSSAIVKCYPGRKFRKSTEPNLGSEDCRPTKSMIDNCRPFLDRELVLVNPQIIVTLGAFPLKVYLRMANVHTIAKLEHFIGQSQLWNGRLVIFFPHTSGGSRWLNRKENRDLFAKAKQVLRSALLARNII